MPWTRCALLQDSLPDRKDRLANVLSAISPLIKPSVTYVAYIICMHASDLS